MDGRPVILTVAMMGRALADPVFPSKMPELAVLARRKSEVAKAAAGRGCSGCRQRRLERSIYAEFLSAVNALAPDAAARLKEYYAVPGILLTGMDRKTGKQQTRVI
jgi:peptide subunit release factor 1 (eRF1)